MCKFTYNFLYTVTCFIHLLFYTFTQTLMLLYSFFDIILSNINSCCTFIYELFSIVPFVCFFFLGSQFKCLCGSQFSLPGCRLLRCSGLYSTLLCIATILLLCLYAEDLRLTTVRHKVFGWLGYTKVNLPRRSGFSLRSNDTEIAASDDMFSAIEESMNSMNPSLESIIVSAIMGASETEREANFLSTQNIKTDSKDEPTPEVLFSVVFDTTLTGGDETEVTEVTEQVQTNAETVTTSTEDIGVNIVVETDSFESDSQDVSFEVVTESLTT